MRTLDYSQPAINWNEAIPIGNGRMGAMIFGGNQTERIQLNEDSIWYGCPQNRCNQDARENLEKIRTLIMEEKDVNQAEQLMRFALSATPQSERMYQPACDLWIQWNQDTSTNYQRMLQLENGLVSEEYTIGTTHIEKEYFASFKEQMIVVHLKSSIPANLNFNVMMTRERFYDGTKRDEKNAVYLWGNGGEGGVRFVIGVRACNINGTLEAIGEHLLIHDADEVTLYISMETSFYHEGEQIDDLRERVSQKLGGFCQKDYDRIKREHIEDYQQLYHRVDFHLNSEQSDNSTLRFTEDYFQFARYLMISGSRPGSLPLNLQGIWNGSMTPPWDSKYTININTEMNYWPAESCNLSECQMPLFDLLKRMQIRGRQVARQMYGCRGFVAHHNTDLWADCAPQDIYPPASYWVMGGAWLCTHIWTHYMYTLDKEFLIEMYPVMREAVLFFHDYLVEQDGLLVTCPSVSPENTYIMQNGISGCICSGATMDIEIIRDLMKEYLKASEVLGIEDDEVRKTEEIIHKLPPLRVGKYGQIMEWNEDYEEAEPGHRHISQLYALHPSHQITVDKTPELANAARKTLERRLSYGGGHTGWSCAWIVNLYARLGDGENAWKNLMKLYEKSTCPNLLCNHPAGDGYVFQIDGNFGALSGITEMLLQSDEDRTILLPAVPKDWNCGSIRGLKIYGGGEIDMKWSNGNVTFVTIRASQNIKTKLRYNQVETDLNLAKGTEFRIMI